MPVTALLSREDVERSCGDPSWDEAVRDGELLETSLSDDLLRAAVVAVVPDALRARPYDEVTFTLIARLAGLTPADVRRCYATKAKMVLAALRRPAARPPRGEVLTRSGREIVLHYLEFWETADNVAILRNLCAAAARDRRLAAALEAHVIAALIAPFAALVRTPDACPRARLACSHLLGLAVSRYVLRREPLASADHETIATWTGPALDYFLKGELGHWA